MICISPNETYKINQPLAVALGTFDGVHIGHAKVISSAVDSSMRTMVVIINRPKQSLETSPLINSPDIRTKIIEQLSADYILEFNFEDVRDLTPEQFVRDILFERLGAKRIFCGFNFRFGKGASGNTEILQKLCDKYEMTLNIVPAVFDNNAPVSSTRIRQAIADGDMLCASRMLGRPYCFDFTVESGDHLGRKLGAPTINQPFPAGYIVPKHGVYAAMVNVDGREYIGVCNVGERPTVRKTHVRAETYILNFSGNLYGKKPIVSLHEFLRPEKKFESLDALKSAIASDALKADGILKNRVK